MTEDDEKHAARVLANYGPATAARLAEMYKAIDGQDGWIRNAYSGYALHAIRIHGDLTSIVVGDETGWRWQVWRTNKGPLRPFEEPPAPSAAEAVRLANEFMTGIRR
ncbi:hypothetical protein AB0B94_31220 [Micromonospora sp. NPDC048986]|uniref:hypothetical protein n=1 Tax=Micromonospora sp. NPDC048986 TaxID=3155644 RepID=UPI0033EC5243